MISFVTSINQKYWEETSQKNINSWLRFFPKDCKIFIFCEDNINDLPKDKRIVWLNLYQECPDLMAFIQKYKDNPHYNGEKTKKDREKFRWNAIKFAHKTFPIFKARDKIQTGQLVWIDADVLAIKKLSEKFLNIVCPNNKAVSYLGRPSTWSECGFVYYNLNLKEGHDFLDEFKSYYTVEGKLDNIRETHDSYIFDQVRINFKSQKLLYDMNSHSVTNKHPFHESPLRECLTHHKGSNKARKQHKFIKRYNINGL